MMDERIVYYAITGVGRTPTILQACAPYDSPTKGGWTKRYAAT